MRPPPSLVYTTLPSPGFVDNTPPTSPSYLEAVLPSFLTEMSIMPFDSLALARLTQLWMSPGPIEVLLWPAQSPDLNPIEQLWTHIKRRLADYEIPPSGIIELWERVEAEWNKIEPKVCQDLIESMPRRVQAVIEAKGGYTKY
jgi:hypothetical protein